MTYKTPGALEDHWLETNGRNHPEGIDDYRTPASIVCIKINVYYKMQHYYNNKYIYYNRIKIL